MINSIYNKDMGPFGILGGTGDLGSSFINFLSLYNHEIYVLIRPESIKKISVRINTIHNNVKLLFGDIFNISIINDIIIKCKTIINFAGLCGLKYKKEQYIDILIINGFMQGVFQQCLQKSSRTNVLFVYPSTQRIYYINKNKLILDWIKKSVCEFENNIDDIISSESINAAMHNFVSRLVKINEIPSNVNIYELSKLLGEQFINKMSRYSNVRISSVYGWGCWPRGKIQRIIYSLQNKLLIEEKHDKRDYIYSTDLSKILFNIVIASEHTKSEFHVVDAVSGQIVDSNDVITKISKIMQCSAGTIFINGNDDDTFLSDNAVGNHFSGNTFTDFDDGLKKTVEYYKHHFIVNEESVYLQNAII